MNSSHFRILVFCLALALFTTRIGSVTTKATPDGNLSVYMPLIEAANTTCAPLPALIYPGDGEGITTLAPDLQFSYTSNPERIGHRIQISTSSTFDTVVYESESDGTSGQGDFTERLNENLAPTTQYYWRVTFFCNDGTSGSTTAAFTTPTVSVPSAPTLLSPEDGVVRNYNSDIYFSFTEVPDASYYRLFFALPISGNQCIILSSDAYPVINPGEDLYCPRELNVPIQWSVRAFTPTGWSEISAPRQITFTE